jgi:hypothetical protein
MIGIDRLYIVVILAGSAIILSRDIRKLRNIPLDINKKVF